MVGLPSRLRGRDKRSLLLGVGGGGHFGARRRGSPPPQPSPARGERAEQRSPPARCGSSSFACSLRQLLQPQPNELRGLRRLAGAARRRSDGGGGLRLTVAEIDQRGDRVGNRARRALIV